MARGAILKVIFENDYLQDEHIIRLCQICAELGVAFVKTSSGYGFVKQPNGDYNYRGATDDHLRLMREYSGPGVQLERPPAACAPSTTCCACAPSASPASAPRPRRRYCGEAVKRGLPGPVPAGMRRDAKRAVGGVLIPPKKPPSSVT